MTEHMTESRIGDSNNDRMIVDLTKDKKYHILCMKCKSMVYGNYNVLGLNCRNCRYNKNVGSVVSGMLIVEKHRNHMTTTYTVKHLECNTIIESKYRMNAIRNGDVICRTCNNGYKTFDQEYQDALKLIK